MNKFILRGFAALFLAAAAAGAEVEFVPAREYFDTALREIARAKSSVTVGMYLITLRPVEPRFLALADALAKAHGGGRRVEVLLDQSPGGPGVNFAAYRHLSRRGVPVFFDLPSVYSHSKVVVVDEHTVLLGSSNWTEAAFDQNQETNVLIRSGAVARDVLAQLRATPRSAPLPDEDLAGFSVPEDFFERSLGDMASAGDERCLDVYLYLLNASTTTVAYGPLAEALGIEKMGPEKYRRQINKTLTKLERRYGLAQVRLAHGQDAAVEWMRGEGPWVPVRYWSDGWSQRLSLAAKCFYLIGRKESAELDRWSRARETMARLYGVSQAFLSNGSVELRRHNLLEVQYDELVDDRRPAVYALNPLYDYEDFEQRRGELAKQYGADKLARAQAAAAAVYEDADLAGIETLIRLEEEKGQAKVNEALAIIGKKNPDNPKRSLGYLIGTIRRL